MSDKRYQVVFTGKLVSDKDTATVTSNLILDIGLSEEKVGLLLNGQRKVLKRFSAVTEAQRLTERLEHAGILCVIEDHASNQGSGQGAGESSLITLIHRLKPVKKRRRTAATSSDAR
ncbi:hypothetical protein [Thiohalomonas denitrificans]|uniref:Uncharacterized protein n=1 Tax=Thiohalomonas denitrificans TaxID=415747 RepID=A0A1G5PV06_9GAMM|nr:hypothetical protein [Thiohalomonas denitrificans]SCZ53465.1 hypothetical protein SAMN03097708_00936 [Thiohalomonas denitrificans]